MLVQGEFLGYLKVCKAYNLVSDLLDEYPQDGFFYWDEDKECLSFTFIEGSTIATLLDHFKVGELDFGNGQDKKKREDF